MPAASVTAPAIAKTVVARPRLIFPAGLLGCPRGFSWPPVPCPRSRPRQTAPGPTHEPHADHQETAIRSAAGSRRAYGREAGSWTPITEIARTRITSRPSTRARVRQHASSAQPPAPSPRRAPRGRPSGSRSRRGCSRSRSEIARERRRGSDRDLGQVRCHRQQDSAAERLAQREPGVEHVGRARKLDPGEPHRHGRHQEDQTSGTNPRPENTPPLYRNDRPARTRRRQRGSPAGTSTSCPLGERLGDASAPTGRSRAVARLGDATERAMLAYDRRRPRRCGANIAAAPPGGYPRSTLPSAPARVVGWRPLRVRCRRACGRGRRTGRCGRSARGSRRVARVVA